MNSFDHNLDLSLESFENIEAAVDDREAGFLIGLAFGVGIVVGAVLAT
ncbi:MAG TPA: hypothetical protein VF619_01775 [Allosphingosinicella sp.]|jgi:hypothetical protein